ncbi:hypothetical protein [Glycomyces sp. MUSA5-2]|uniref:hypothetical protein n=1 Tax=Glycomyces sp. MUSA5-2 TaxID=2053002 RepID=UPI00300AC298
MNGRQVDRAYFEEKMRRTDFLEDIWQLGLLTQEAAAEIYEKLIMEMPKEEYRLQG